ncbi:MAG: glycosyltransferase [Jatrophihabitans sp.]|uniref:glycosyltransferase n=1 Tax=Jatrophihabitans sp. TaxID=1932789 RepID=UPI003F7F5242
MTTDRVAAVVVTYNRRALLTEALAAVAAQTRRPDVIIVVDNASTDGTADLVRTEHPDVRLVTMSANTGGAGGFAAGIAAALADRAALVWVMDDDTVPEPDALAALLRAREVHPLPRPAVLASRVVWTDGRPHPMNTPRPRPFAPRRLRVAAELARGVPIRSASFVSALFDAEVIRERGLPVADYFLWNDDFEYTARLIRDGTGVLCPDSVVVHKTATFGSTDVDPGARFYYEVRNKVWLFRYSDALARWERLVYGGSTLRRWARTLARSHDRPTLWSGLRRGLRDGRTPPRPTEAILAEASALGRPQQ